MIHIIYRLENYSQVIFKLLNSRSSPFNLTAAIMYLSYYHNYPLLFQSYWMSWYASVTMTTMPAMPAMFVTMTTLPGTLIIS